MGAKEVRAALSSNIRLLRHRRKWSQADLADKAGISITFLSDIERGNKWPFPETLSSLAEAFDIDVYKLFKPEDNMSDVASDLITRFAKDLTVTVNHSINSICEQYLAKP
jgi:transcriptional regulator with XRE-family HTH domain